MEEGREEGKLGRENKPTDRLKQEPTRTMMEDDRKEGHLRETAKWTNQQTEEQPIKAPTHTRHAQTLKHTAIQRLRGRQTQQEK